METRERAALRKRTTISLPMGLLDELDRVREDLGMTRSHLLATAAACFMIQIVPVLSPGRRDESLETIRVTFDKLMDGLGTDAQE